MRSLWLGVFVCTAMFVACGDDDSDFATRPSDDSSSSVCEDCDDESSSSVTPKSSDSETSVSSSSTKSSSSSAKADGSEYDAIANTLKDLRDGQTYKTVKIGEQIWMAENLNYAYLQRTSELDSSSFFFNDSAEYCGKFGRLYTWAAAMDSAGSFSTNGKGCGYSETCNVASEASATLVRGVCHDGWHLPSQTEWNILFMATSSDAGTTLKSSSGWTSGGNGTDDFGFSALPAGRYGYGEYDCEDFHAFFWSSTEYGSYGAYNMYLNYNYDSAYMKHNDKYYGFSVRCVKDDP
jgi:uncharacterized protein (TIGR02145 family)